MATLSVGWKEWVALPELGIPAIKAKVDTGARTSALHASAITFFEETGKRKVRFEIHPIPKRPDIVRSCTADLVDQRVVINSGGYRENRLVITTPIQIGDQIWPIEITLTNRVTMRFRMLLGRTTLANRVIVDPGAAYLTGRDLARAYRKK
jgi:hypothetical protein